MQPIHSHRTPPIVVVGGGVVGLSAAYELTWRGRDVVVLDRGEVGTGCAVGSAGHIVPSHVIPLASPGAPRTAVGSLVRPDGPLRLRWLAAPALARWMLAFVRSCNQRSVDTAAPALAELSELSVTLMQEWISAEGIDCGERCDGLLDVYGSERALAAAARPAEELRRWGVAVDLLDGAAVRVLEPAVNDSAIGAVFFPDDRSVHPGRFLAGMRGAVEARGATLRSHSEVVDLDGDGDRISAVRTGTETFEASHVVVATGAWTGGMSALLGDEIPVQPGRGLSVTFDRPSRGPGRPLLLGEKHVAVSPLGDELRLSGWFELGNFSTKPEPRRIAKLESLARTRVGFDDPLVMRRRWAGLRPVTPDGVPIIDRSSRWRNLIVATGHAMVGLSLGPATGRVVAQLVCGEEPDVGLERFSLGRFG